MSYRQQVALLLTAVALVVAQSSSSSSSSSATATRTSRPTPTPTHTPDHKDNGLSKGAIAGIVVGSVIGGLLLLAIPCLFCFRSRFKKGNKQSEQHEHHSTGVQEKHEQRLIQRDHESTTPNIEHGNPHDASRCQTSGNGPLQTGHQQQMAPMAGGGITNAAYHQPGGATQQPAQNQGYSTYTTNSGVGTAQPSAPSQGYPNNAVTSSMGGSGATRGVQGYDGYETTRAAGIMPGGTGQSGGTTLNMPGRY